MVEDAYNFVRDTAANGGTVLFVGTKKQAGESIREEALRCGMYYVNARWLGGMMTNFKTMRGRVDRMNQLKKMGEDGTFDMLPKKEVIKLMHEQEKLEKYLGGVKDMKTLPGAIFMAALAVIPSIIFSFTSNNVVQAFGGTSILIMVGVAMDTISSLESQLKMHNYEGFFK
jgi:ribosomal protein S2